MYEARVRRNITSKSLWLIEGSVLSWHRLALALAHHHCLGHCSIFAVDSVVVGLKLHSVLELVVSIFWCKLYSLKGCLPISDPVAWPNGKAFDYDSCTSKDCGFDPHRDLLLLLSTAILVS